MRYGLISDIHGNLEALKAVIDTLSKESIDEYLCVGDVVGYGADPAACIGLIKLLRPRALIAGNHDWAALEMISLEYFNDAAAEAVLWTRNMMAAGDMDFLRSFSLTYSGGTFSLVHGSIIEPERFNYILAPYDAYENMQVMKNDLCFIGHSHFAGIFSSDKDGARLMLGSHVKMSPDRKYIVNVGSVGQPRDGNPRASFAIYDDSKMTVEIKRVEYDIKFAQEKILKAGLPEWLALRLAEGR